MKKHVALFSSALMMSTTLLGAGSVFADVTSPEHNTAKTPVSAALTLDETPGKPTLPTTPEGGGDQSTEIEGLFGIAYAPGSLSGSAELSSTPNQEVPLSNGSATKYNVGVQDKTRKKDQEWTLKASLSWEGDTNNYMSGTSIKANGLGVKENKEGTLEDLENAEVTTDKIGNLEIQKDTQVEIMQSVKGQTMNGVYNYQFEAPKLVIPDPERVTAGNYNGNIIWSLENTPSLP
ncbi:WxL domain-containing protein [Enterococcus faecium]|nr:WxL domain-containing protein [Enterococcus faecium]